MDDYDTEAISIKMDMLKTALAMIQNHVTHPDISNHDKVVKTQSILKKLESAAANIVNREDKETENVEQNKTTNDIFTNSLFELFSKCYLKILDTELIQPGEVHEYELRCENASFQALTTARIGIQKYDEAMRGCTDE